MLNDLQILRLCTGCEGIPGLVKPRKPMIDPMVAEQKQSGVISYGLTSFGYDMRAAPEWCLFTDRNGHVIDPKQPSDQYFERIFADSLVIPPNSYALTRSLEYVAIPDDVMAICVGKSTYARVGLHVNVTPLEPGWEGHVTIEVSNATRCPIKVYANEGIMQVLFFQGDRPMRTYADKNGKYQGQTGVTLARVVASDDGEP